MKIVAGGGGRRGQCWALGPIALRNGKNAHPETR
jgi:hypothetical protein